MILHELQLSNFRQFYGLSPAIRFAKGASKVSVLYGVGANPNLTHPANPILTQGWVLTA